MQALAVILALASTSPVFGITPELSPTSDKKFFGAKGDYPTDTRNNKVVPSHNNFNYPFPIVQDSNTYDKDYVKDENSDNGYYKIQMEYDRLRKVLADKEQVLEVAKETEAHHAAELAADAVKPKPAKPVTVTVKDAQDMVGQAESNLKKCLEDLEAAKKELARRKEVEVQKHQEEDVKEQHEVTAHDEVAEAKAFEEKAEEKLGEEQEENAQSQKTLAEAKEDYKKLHGDLEKAEDELRKFMPARGESESRQMRKQPCPKGCKNAYENLKSAGPRTEAGLTVCVIAAMLALGMQ